MMVGGDGGGRGEAQDGEGGAAGGGERMLVEGG